MINVCGPLGNRDRDSEFGHRPVLVPEDGRKRIAVLAARLCDLASQALRDFHCLRHASAFRYQSWNVRACAQVAAILEVFHTDTNGDFLDLCQMFLAPHSVTARKKTSRNSIMAGPTGSLFSSADLEGNSEKEFGSFVRRRGCRERRAPTLYEKQNAKG